MRISLEKPLVFIDLETTGKSTVSDRIVELTALKVHPNKTEELLHTRINPGIPIPPEATAIHGITNDDVIDAPRFGEYAAVLQNFLHGCDLGGFNIKTFDLEILEAEFQRAETEFSRKDRAIIDVKTIYHKFEPRDLSAAYKRYCGKELAGHHSSEADARATFDIWKSQLESHPDLPHTMSELHEFCDEQRPPHWIDRKGKFIWVGDEAVVNFSPKYKGRTLMSMASDERGFLEWMLCQDFFPDAKKIASDALKGQFPRREKTDA